MPFGAVYGALFYAVLLIWLVLAPGDAAPPAGMRWALALLCCGLALGLPLRRGWARWGGATLAAALIPFNLFFAAFGGGTVTYLLLFGSVATAALLFLPATGDVRRGVEPGRMLAPRFGRLLEATTAVGLVGLMVATGWGFSRATAIPRDDEPAAVKILGLSERVRWTGFASGVQQARNEDKPLLVIFVTDWCGYCRKMDRTTWKHPSVVDRVGELIAVRVNAEEVRAADGPSGRDLAARYGVGGFPTVMVLNPAGEVIASRSGYMEPRQFLTWLESAMVRLGREPGRVRTAAR